MTDIFPTAHGVPFMSKQQMDDIHKLFDGAAWQKMSIKTADDIDKMKAAGAIGAHVLERISSHIKPGVSLREIDRLTHELIVDKYGAEIVRLAVKTSGTGLEHTDKIAASYALNDIIENALASDTELQVGDLFGIDVSARKDGWSSDTARRSLDWAGTMHNLANTLSNLGERESGTDHLEEAVMVYLEGINPRACAVPLGENSWQSRNRNGAVGRAVPRP